MKKIILVLISITFLFAGTAFSAGGYERRNNNLYKIDKRDHRPHYQEKKNHHNTKYRQYTYKRHYTWREWRYERDYYHHKRGVYHNDDTSNHLFFSYCENGSCFTISIGD